MSKKEEPERRYLSSQRITNHIKQVENMLHMAHRFSGRALSLKNLAQGKHGGHKFADVKELGLLLLILQSEVGIEARIYIQFEVLALNFFCLFCRFDILHVLFLEISPLLVRLPVIVNVVDEVSTVTPETICFI